MNNLKDFTIRSGETLLYFGISSTEKALSHLRGFKKALIVTGKSSAKVSGALEDVLRALKDNGTEYIIFDKVKANPTIEIVNEIVEVGKSFGADSVIAIGGGSVIDSAKVAAASIKENIEPVSYYKKGAKPKEHLFLLAINLTHGTGTEIDRYAVVTIPQTKEKIGASIIYPNVSVDNPRYLLTLSKEQTLFTALDAFYHALESSVSIFAMPFSQDLSESAVRYIVKYLGNAVSNPRDIEARYWLLYASMLAGISIDYSFTTIIHAQEHGLSGVNPRLEHGAGLAIIGPYFLPILYKAFPEEANRILRIIDPSLRPVPEDAERASIALKKFQESVGFKYTLRDYGFDEDTLKEAVEVSWPLLEPRIPKEKYSITKELAYELLKKAL